MKVQQKAPLHRRKSWRRSTSLSAPPTVGPRGSRMHLMETAQRRASRRWRGQTTPCHAATFCTSEMLLRDTVSAGVLAPLAGRKRRRLQVMFAFINISIRFVYHKIESHRGHNFTVTKLFVFRKSLLVHLLGCSEVSPHLWSAIKGQFYNFACPPKIALVARMTNEYVIFFILEIFLSNTNNFSG